MALEKHRYRDPEQVAIIDEIRQVKESHGCAACRMRDRDAQAFGRFACGIGKKPWKRGFCPEWRFDEGWGV